jgi:AcrR family transcriptional regulator
MISRERAVEEALKAIDEGGLEAFGLASVAERLGVRVPSLYYHFHDKSELLSEVSRKLFMDAEQDVTRPGTDWKSWLINTSLAVRRSLLRHPNAVPLVLLNPPRDIVLKGYERTLRYLERCEIPKETRVLIIAGLDAIVWGSTLFEAAAVSRGIRSFALFDPVSFENKPSSNSNRHINDEAMYIAVARSFLDGLAIDTKALSKDRRRAAKK